MVMSTGQDSDDELYGSDSESNAPAPSPPPEDGHDVQAPGAYAIIRPEGNGVVNLTAQHIHTRQTVREAITRLEVKLIFENAFPDTITLSQNIHDTLVNVAHDLGFTGLELALRLNAQVSGPLAPMV